MVRHVLVHCLARGVMLVRMVGWATIEWALVVNQVMRCDCCMYLNIIIPVPTDDVALPLVAVRGLGLWDRLWSNTLDKET